MAWTTYAASIFNTGKPGKGSIIKGIYDNITAMANGDAGAPEIQTAAYAAQSVDTAALKNANVTKAKMAASSVGGSQIVNSFQAFSSQTITTASPNWTVPAGIYIMVMDASSLVKLQIYDGTSTWYGINEPNGLIMSDGTNIKLRNDGASDATVYYRKISD